MGRPGHKGAACERPSTHRSALTPERGPPGAWHPTLRAFVAERRRTDIWRGCICVRLLTSCSLLFPSRILNTSNSIGSRHRILDLALELLNVLLSHFVMLLLLFLGVLFQHFYFFLLTMLRTAEGEGSAAV